MKKGPTTCGILQFKNFEKAPNAIACSKVV